MNVNDTVINENMVKQHANINKRGTNNVVCRAVTLRDIMLHYVEDACSPKRHISNKTTLTFYLGNTMAGAQIIGQ